MSKKRTNATPASQSTQTKQEKRKLARNTYLAVGVTAVLMVSIFVGKWVFAIRDSYFGSFVQRDEFISTAMETFTTITPSEEDAILLMPLLKEWDVFTSSRLRDEVTITAEDGTALHGYYYDEGSDVTVVFLHKYDDSGASDFLLGSRLYDALGCNILLPDARAHGESGGEYTGFGYLEQYDLTCWLEWAEEKWGEQTFLIWGVGTGANTAIYAECSGLLPDSVALIVAESPFASLHEVAEHHLWETFEIPVFPFLYPIEWELAKSEAGYTVEDLELASHLKESDAETPVIFLASANDGYMLPEWSRAVYDAYCGEKTLICGGNGHGTVGAACLDEILIEIASRLS